MAFSSQDAPVDLERIVVSRPKACLVNTYSQSYDSIETLPADSPVEGLNFLPLDLQSRMLNSGIQTDFSLRGSNFQGVLMLLNGQRINDPQTGHFNSDIPLTKEDIEDIKVMPGASSSLFGPDAIGGALDFQLKNPAEKKLVLELSGGRFNSAAGLFSASGKLTDNFSARLSVQRRESAGFHYDTDFNDFISTLATSLAIPDGELNTSFGYQDKRFGAFDFYTPGLGYPSKEWTKTCLFDTGLNLNKAGWLVKPNFIWRRHYDKFVLDKTGIRSTYLNRHCTDMFTPNLYFQRDAAGLGRMGFGLEYGQERINSTNLGKHSRDHKSIFIDDGKELSREFSLGSSFRLDDFAGFDKTCSGAINLKYRLSEINSLNLGLARNIRIPSFTELYYNDPTTIGDAGLSSEKAMNYQLGYERKEGEFYAGATVFFRDEKDMIDWVKTMPGQVKFKADNITQDRASGIEGYAKLKLNRWCDLDANYTYVNRQSDKKGYIYKYGQNYTRHLSNILCTFRLPFGIQTLGWTYKKKPGRSGWLVMDAHFAYGLNRNTRFFFNATNLLNSAYEEIVGIPQPGRYVEGGLKFEW
jgi:outer membrane cobalamin receptor